MRLFIATFLPEKIISEVLRVQSILKVLSIDTKFTVKENLHITLDYIGEVDDKEKEKIIKILDQIKFQSFKVHLSHIDISKRKNEPMIWLRVLGENLTKLANNIKSEVSEVYDSDGSRNKKPFWGHITLARVKDNYESNVTKLQNIIKETSINKLEFEINEFYLIESKLYPKGPEYIKLKKFKLNKS